MTNEDKHLLYWIMKLIDYKNQTSTIQSLTIDKHSFESVNAPAWTWPAFIERKSAFQKFDKEKK